jgi:hypothetical protein
MWHSTGLHVSRGTVSDSSCQPATRLAPPMLIQERLSHRQLDLEHLSFLRAISVDHLELNPCPCEHRRQGPCNSFSQQRATDRDRPRPTAMLQGRTSAAGMQSSGPSTTSPTVRARRWLCLATALTSFVSISLVRSRCARAAASICRQSRWVAQIAP